MIHHLHGLLMHVAPPAAIIECNGVGYEVLMPMTCIYHLPEPGTRVHVYTHLQIREDAHQIFGFIHEKARVLFRQLIKVNGVGPKLALSILSGISVDELLLCIHEQSLNRLVKVPGVGKRTAERLLIEMKDKLPVPASTGLAPLNTDAFIPNRDPEEDAISALVALGYRATEAKKAVVAQSSVASSEEKIKQALQCMLGK